MLYTEQYTIHTKNKNEKNVYFTLCPKCWTEHCTVNNAHCTLQTTYITLHTAKHKLCTAYSILHTTHSRIHIPE